MKTLKLIPFFLLMFICPVFSQDAEGCKDHELFARMPGYFIAECSMKFEMAQIMMADGNETEVKGEITYLYYAPKEDLQSLPAFDQIIKYYEKASAKLEGKKIFINSDRATLRLKSAHKQIWLSLKNWESTNGKGYYELTVIETE
jgi:hypothetical protein